MTTDSMDAATNKPGGHTVQTEHAEEPPPAKKSSKKRKTAPATGAAGKQKRQRVTTTPSSGASASTPKTEKSKGKERWLPEQDAFWRSLHENRDDATSFKDLYKTFTDECEKRQWPPKKYATAMKRRRVLCGQVEARIKWTDAEQDKVRELYGTLSVSRSRQALLDEYNEWAEQQQLPTRTLNAFTNKAANLPTPDEIASRDTLQESRWALEEHKFIENKLGLKRVPPVAEIWRGLNKHMKRVDPQYKVRSRPAVLQRVRLQRMKKAPAPTPRRRAAWGAEQDEALKAALTSHERPLQAVGTIARRFRLPFSFVRIRYGSLLARGETSVQVDDAAEGRDEDEERSLRGLPPRNAQWPPPEDIESEMQAESHERKRDDPLTGMARSNTDEARAVLESDSDDEKTVSECDDGNARDVPTPSVDEEKSSVPALGSDETFGDNDDEETAASGRDIDEALGDNDDGNVASHDGDDESVPAPMEESVACNAEPRTPLDQPTGENAQDQSYGETEYGPGFTMSRRESILVEPELVLMSLSGRSDNPSRTIEREADPCEEAAVTTQEASTTDAYREGDERALAEGHATCNDDQSPGVVIEPTPKVGGLEPVEEANSRVVMEPSVELLCGSTKGEETKDTQVSHVDTAAQSPSTTLIEEEDERRHEEEEDEEHESAAMAPMTVATTPDVDAMYGANPDGDHAATNAGLRLVKRGTHEPLSSPKELSQLDLLPMSASSPLKRIVAQARVRENGGVLWARIYDRNLPRLTYRRMLELVFCAQYVNNWSVMVDLWLRCIWRAPCRDPQCCLLYDFSNSAYQRALDDRCRHWFWFKCERVHLRDFANAEDYICAMMLANMTEARWAARNGAQGRPGESKSYSVGAFGHLPKCFKNWDKFRRGLPPLADVPLSWMTGIVLDAWNEAGHGEFQQKQVSDHQDTGDVTIGDVPNVDNLQSMEMGTVKLSRAKDAKEYTALLVWCDAWVLATNAPMEEMNNVKRVWWTPHYSLLTQARRASCLFERARVVASKPPTTILSWFWNRHLLFIPRATQLSPAPQLDQYQAAARDSVLQNKGIHLLHGPYGCGKSTVQARIITDYARIYPEETVAVVAESNTAVDVLLKKVVDLGECSRDRILRVGIFHEEMEGYGEYFSSVKEQEYYQRMRAYPVGQTKTVKKQLARARETMFGAKVIFMTLATAGRETLKALKLDVVMVDEAAQAVEASLFQAIRENTHTLILFGDPLQMKGFSNLPEKNRETFSNDFRRHGLLDSVLHSFSTGREEFPGLKLQCQYRCHPAIGNMAQGFYQFEIYNCAKESADYLADMSLPILVPKSSEGRSYRKMGRDRMIFLSAHHASRLSVNYARYNVLEVWLVVEIVLRIVREVRDRPITLFVITPYHEQRQRIQDTLDRITGLIPGTIDWRVMTLDSCQGGEADITILSMVRHDAKLGFLEGSVDRFLVALTRARDYCFVLAHRPTFEKEGSTWPGLYQQAENTKQVAVEWTDLRENEARENLRDRREQERLCTPRDTRRR